MTKRKTIFVNITVQPSTREALNKLKAYGDSYDSVILRLIEIKELRSAP